MTPARHAAAISIRDCVAKWCALTGSGPRMSQMIEATGDAKVATRAINDAARLGLITGRGYLSDMRPVIPAGRACFVVDRVDGEARLRMI